MSRWNRKRNNHPLRLEPGAAALAAVEELAGATFLNATPAELRIIGLIVYRAVSMEIYKSHERTMCRRDLDAVHSNGCPLRLADLLATDGFTFAHDLCGIKAHLDRYTGKLDMFLPRLSQPATNPSAGWTLPKTAPSSGPRWVVPKKAVPSGGWVWAISKADPPKARSVRWLGI